MSITSSVLQTFNPFFLGLLSFLLFHMMFYLFSYSSLLFSLIVIYSSVFGISCCDRLDMVYNTCVKECRKHYMKGALAPFTTSGWSNVEVDDKGNIIDDSGDESDDEAEEISDDAADDDADDADSGSRTGPKSKCV